MAVTEVGIVMDEREVQYAKAQYPMVVTEVGMVMDEREVQ